MRPESADSNTSGTVWFWPGADGPVGAATWVQSPRDSRHRLGVEHAPSRRSPNDLLIQREFVLDVEHCVMGQRGMRMRWRGGGGVDADGGGALRRPPPTRLHWYVALPRTSPKGCVERSSSLRIIDRRQGGARH